MRTFLLLAAAAILAATFAPTVSADVVIRQCGPDVGCSGFGTTIPTDVVACVITLPAQTNKIYAPVMCHLA